MEDEHSRFPANSSGPGGCCAGRRRSLVRGGRWAETHGWVKMMHCGVLPFALKNLFLFFQFAATHWFLVSSNTDVIYWAQSNVYNVMDSQCCTALNGVSHYWGIIQGGELSWQSVQHSYETHDVVWCKGVDAWSQKQFVVLSNPWCNPITCRYGSTTVFLCCSRPARSTKNVSLASIECKHIEL